MPAAVHSPSVGYVDLKTLSGYAGVSVKALRRYIHDPDFPLPCRRLPGKILVKMDEFERWMAQFQGTTKRRRKPRTSNDIVDALTAGLI